MTFRHDQEHEGMGRAVLALALASAIAGALTGCGEPTGSDPALDPFVPPISEPVAGEPFEGLPPPPPPSRVDEVCPADVRIGKMVGAGECPSATGWTRQKLFPPGAPAPFSSYCRYTWTGADTPDPTKINPDGGRSGPVWTEPDCMSVTPMASADEAEQIVKSSLRASFRNAVERPGSLPTPGSAGSIVHIAIIDTWPSVIEAGNSRHGLGMAGVIDDLTCDQMSGTCPIQIIPHLALNLLEPGMPDNTGGGYFGHQTRLATQIYDAVATWEAESPGSKLIINLSVGWDRTYHEGAYNTARPSAQAVRDALEYAKCQGALLIAAAGNSSFGPNPVPGMIFPAAWEDEIVSCSSGPKKLLWAVGGVDALDRPLYNARHLGMPALAAPAELVYGIGDLATGPVLAGPFTGTSAAAAVASAAAAAVWMYGGGLDAEMVMDLVTTSAVPLSIPRTACPSGQPVCGQVKRISICRAVAVVEPSVPCINNNSLLHGEGGGFLPTWTADELAAVELLPSVTYGGPALDNPLDKPACSLDIYRPAYAQFPGENACPMEQYDNAVLAPATGPQPGPDPCGSCGLAVISGSDATLEMAISSELKDPVFAQTLTLYKDGFPYQRFDVGSLKLDGDPNGDKERDTGLLPGEVYKLQITSTNGTFPVYGADFDAAVLEWVNYPDIQTTSRVVVFER